MLRILLPKARSEQRRWRQTMDSQEVDVTFIDPWHLERVEETPVTRTIWLNLDRYDGVICISPTAALVLIDALDHYWPMPPINVHWMCNGPRTAEVLENAGLKSVFPTIGHTAEDVLALPPLNKVAGQRWLVVKGEGGRSTYRDELTAAGARVDTIDVYRRSVDYDVLNTMAMIAENCDAIWMSSEYLGQQLIDQRVDFWRQWKGQWWVSSDRLARWARTNELKTVKVADGATADAFVSMLASENK